MRIEILVYKEIKIWKLKMSVQLGFCKPCNLKIINFYFSFLVLRHLLYFHLLYNLNIHYRIAFIGIPEHNLTMKCRNFFGKFTNCSFNQFFKVHHLLTVGIQSHHRPSLKLWNSFQRSTSWPLWVSVYNIYAFMSPVGHKHVYRANDVWSHRTIYI